MLLAIQLAVRFLREGRTQSLLILAGVTIGVAAYVFITATMQGVQSNLIDKTLGSQPHLTVRSEAAPPRPLLTEAEGRRVLRTALPPEPRARPFDQWQRALRQMESTPGVVAVSPQVGGAALAVRGGAQQAVQIVGAHPDRLAQIIDLPGNLTAGAFRPAADQVVIGAGLADELGVTVGRTFRVQSDTGEATVRVAGIFALGSGGVDDTWVVTSLRTGQAILGRPGDVTSIDANVTEVFGAAAVAARVAARTGLDVESWEQRNASLLQALDAQNQSTLMVRAFTLLAVAMGIASVLAVSVVQRRGQIGILRAIGVSRGVILQVFLWQGALLGLVGAALGTGLGAVVASFLERVVPFPIVIDAATGATAAAISVATGLLASAWPARTASRMDPAAAIRGDA